MAASLNPAAARPASGTPRLSRFARTLPRDIVAGLIASLLPISNSFSYAALLFSGPWQAFLGQGVAMLLISGAVTAAIVAISGSFRVAVAAPIAATSALLAVMLTRLTPDLDGQSAAVALGTAYAALGAATVATGAILLGLGLLRVGGAIRFVPYSVVAGFMGATGWLMIAGAVRMSTDVPLEIARLPEFLAPRPDMQLLCVVGFAAILIVVTRRFSHPLTIPLGLALTAAATDAALQMLHVPFAAARSLGWLFDVGGDASASMPLLSGSLLQADWAAVGHVVPGVVAIAVIGVVQTLLTATGLEMSLDVDADLDRELRAQGMANVASGLLGGTVGFTSTSYTLLNAGAGARGRASGVVVGLTSLAAIGWGGSIVAMIPRFVLGGLLLMLGLRLVWEWGIASRRRMMFREWLLAISIIPVTAVLGFLPALLLGLLGGCVLLALSMSRIGVLRRRYGIDESRSSLQRPEDEMLMLGAHGGEAQVLELGGFMFFGSAHLLYVEVKRIVAAGGVHVLLLDCSRVVGIDSAASATVERIRGLARKAGLQVIVAGLKLEMTSALANPLLDQCASLDEGIEAAEAAILARHHATARLADDGAGRDAWLSAALGDAELARELVERVSFEPQPEGTILCRQGDSTDTLLFIESGRVSVLVGATGQPSFRVRVFGPRTVAGELAFLLGTPRTATLRVERQASVGFLDRETFRAFSEHRPKVALALLDYLVRVQAERLGFANRQITALQR